MNKEALLNVAKALRESPKPGRFDMGYYVDDTCGTPACALGHYASREDLQNFMRLVKDDDGDWTVQYVERVAENNYVDFEHDEVCEHFGISLRQATQLFGPVGCGGAKAANDAAEYIEHFVAQNS